MKRSLLELADEAIGWVRKQASLGAEVYLYRGKDRGVELKEGRLEILQQSEDEGMGLRLVDQGRMGFSYAGGLDMGLLPDLFDKATRQMAHLPWDEHRILALPSVQTADARTLAGTLCEAGLFDTPLRDWLPRLKGTEARALKNKRIRKVLQLGFGQSEAEVAIASTTGVRTLERGTSASAGLATVAENGSEVQVGSASQAARLSKTLDLDRLADEAVWRSVSLLGSQKLPTKRRSVLFDPWIAGEFLDLIVGALSADSVQMGRSLLKGKLGERIASPLATFIDDPRRPGGVASALFDDEGVPTRKKSMIERGVLKEYFYDAYTAHKDNRLSNGCASRSSFKGLPGPSSSNFYMEPGTISRDGLLSDTADGVLVTELMGMHTADPVSGEFSVGVSGVALEKGQLARGVRGAMVSGNILAVLSRIDAVADDLFFYGSWAAPTFRVADLTLA